MYIPEIVLFAIIILISIYSFNKTERHADEIRNLKSQQEEKERKQIQQRREESAAKEKQYELALIKAVYDCSDRHAEKVHTTLKNAGMCFEFCNAETNKERKAIYDKAKIEEAVIDEFRDYAQVVLMPIVHQNNYDITLENLVFWKEDFEKKIDIPIAEKLFQLNNEKYLNVTYLLQAVEPAFPNSADAFSYIYNSLSNGDGLKIIECYNAHFNMGFSDEEILKIQDQNHILPYLNDLTMCTQSLESLFIACIYVKKLIPHKLYNNPLLTKTQNHWAFYHFLMYLFFQKPYYDLCNYKSVIKQHRQELESFQSCYLPQTADY